MDHVIQGLTMYGIADLLTSGGWDELATFRFRDEQGGPTHLLVAVDVGLVDLTVVDSGPSAGQIHLWNAVRAGIDWTYSGTPPVPKYRLLLSVLDKPVPRPEPANESHAWDDLRRHVMARATGT